jgi:hypothetical protein
MKPMSKNSVLLLLSLLLLLNTGCKKFPLEKPEEFDINTVINLTPIPESLDLNSFRANGFSSVAFKAHIHQDSSEKWIMFSATSGTFVGAQNVNSIVVPIDKNGAAYSTYIVGRKRANVEVVASVLNFRDVKNLDLKIAHADDLFIESSSGFVSKSGLVMATIKAILTRGDNRGWVSIGAPVNFHRFQLNDQKQEVVVGRFLNHVTTDASGTASITFAADVGGVIVGRPVTIRVKAEKDNGEYVTKDLYLNVIE